MNYQNELQHMTRENEAPTSLPQAVELLELFAEDLPSQHDLMQPHCVGTFASAGTAATSTVGTLSTFSTL